MVASARPIAPLTAPATWPKSSIAAGSNGKTVTRTKAPSISTPEISSPIIASIWNILAAASDCGLAFLWALLVIPNASWTKEISSMSAGKEAKAAAAILSNSGPLATPASIEIFTTRLLDVIEMSATCNPASSSKSKTIKAGSTDGGGATASGSGTVSALSSEIRWASCGRASMGGGGGSNFGTPSALKSDRSVTRNILRDRSKPYPISIHGAGRKLRPKLMGPVSGRMFSRASLVYSWESYSILRVNPSRGVLYSMPPKIPTVRPENMLNSAGTPPRPSAGVRVRNKGAIRVMGFVNEPRDPTYPQPMPRVKSRSR